jgi:hypothetical protein
MRWVAEDAEERLWSAAEDYARADADYVRTSGASLTRFPPRVDQSFFSWAVGHRHPTSFVMEDGQHSGVNFDFWYWNKFVTHNLRGSTDSTHQSHHGYIFPANNQKPQAFVSVLTMTVAETGDAMSAGRKRRNLRDRTIFPRSAQALCLQTEKGK